MGPALEAFGDQKQTFMKTNAKSVGFILLIASLWASGQEGAPRGTIALTCGGQFMEVVVQRQQRAQKGSETPTFLDVGVPLVIENWVEEATIPPGLDGRISKFQPPYQIIVTGYIYQVGEAMGEVRKSTGEQTTKYTTVTGQPAAGTPPDGYRWTGEIRVATRSELVTWSREWRCFPIKLADPEQVAAGQPSTRPESK